MNIYNMKLEQFQVNTKFLSSLSPEWNKFMTDVKLVKDLHTTNFDQLHANLEQHILHANEVRLMRERNQDPLALGTQGQSYSGTGYKSNATSSGGINTEDLDTYDSFCDDISNAKVVIMAKISNYGSDVISEVPHSESYLNDMENQSVHTMQDFKQTQVVDVVDNEITRFWDFGKCFVPLSEDFGKCFVPQQELSAEQDFYYHMSNPSTKSFDASPFQMKAPKELPKVSLVNESVKPT
nr:hypothetical protein [Tanacetum cinerariifolium]